MNGPKETQDRLRAELTAFMIENRIPYYPAPTTSNYSPKDRLLEEASLLPIVDFRELAGLAELRTQDVEQAAREKLDEPLRWANESVEFFEGLGIAPVLNHLNTSVWEGKGEVITYTERDKSGRFKTRSGYTLRAAIPDSIVESGRTIVEGPIIEKRVYATNQEGQIDHFHYGTESVMLSPGDRVNGAYIHTENEVTGVGIDLDHTINRSKRRINISDSGLSFSGLQIDLYPEELRGRISLGVRGMATLSISNVIDDNEVARIMQFINITLAYLSIPRIRDPYSDRIRRAEQELAKFMRKVGTLVPHGTPFEVISVRK